MNKLFNLNLVAAALASLLLSGCGDAETEIVEKESIEVVDDHGDDDHDDEFTIESMGRIAVLSGESDTATLYDLDDSDLLDTFTLTHTNNTLTYSAGYRFAIIGNRSNNYVGFIDGGLWREDHGAHLHDYQQAPKMSDFELSSSRPTHIVKHDGQTVVFFDGDADAGAPASVQVLTDTDISGEADEIDTLSYTVNMHGVAKPQGEHLLSTVRRDDADSTSGAKILPDQVGVYHLHDHEYEQEQILATTCPDLHGAAQNETYVVFGCSDGILVAHLHEGEYESEKILNTDDLDDLRIGTIYGHEESDSFIGIASEHGGGQSILFSIHPEEGELEKLEWQPEAGSNPVAYAFAYEAEQFLVLDNQGYLNILSPHQHDGEVHWELETRLDITEQDVANMPDGLSFSMTTSQNGHFAYISDPIAKHVLAIDLEAQNISGDIETSFAPKSVVWLGIAEEAHSHD